MTTAFTFPAKMTLVHARAVPSIEKTSYSQSFLYQNLKVAIGRNFLTRNLRLRQERELSPVKKSPFLPRASPSHSCTTEFPLSFHLKNKRDSYTGEPNGDWIRKLRPPEETVKQTLLFPCASQSRSRAPVFPRHLFSP